MLTTYLHGFISKFIILEDDLEEPGHHVFKYLINQDLKTQLNIIYCQFNYNLRKNISNKNQLSVHYDMTKLQAPEALQQFTNLIATTTVDSILIIDSLAHMIYKLGARECYKLLNKINKTSDFKQILTQLHSDLLHEQDDVLLHISSLATLHIKMERQFGKRPRLSYTFKKGRGKVIRAIEEFSFPDGKLTMTPVAEIDVKSFLQGNNTPDVNSLTTFNIELNEQDKINRSQMDLPFLPRDLRTEKVETTKPGEIHYVFDAGDDWDAEDPDDDLDI